MASIHPALLPANTDIPVTPGPHTEGQSAYFDPQSEIPSTTSSPQQAYKRSSGSHWNANSYTGHPESKHRRPSSPSEAAAGARSGEELLRRLSLNGQRPQNSDKPESDPRVTHPSLNLSGNVISATFAVPYKISYASGCEWVSATSTPFARVSTLTVHRNWHHVVAHLLCLTLFLISRPPSLRGTTLSSVGQAR